jgi:hypothetical protein
VLVTIAVVLLILSDVDFCAKLRDVRNRVLARSEEKTPEGWNRVPAHMQEPTTDAELAEQKRKLESLAYLSGSRWAPGQQSVVHYDVGYAYDGFNLYNSAHAPEALLIDMNGKTVHRWSRTAAEVWPDFEPEADEWGHTCWRRVYLYPNGDLLAMFVGVGLIKLDRHSNLLWAYRSVAHHDVTVAPDGSIFVLTRKAKVDPQYNRHKPILEDFVTQLDPDGNELRSISVLKALENSSFAPAIARIKKKMQWLGGYGDILHTNAIEVLDGTLADRIPAFRAGNLLLSPLFPEMICVMDLDTEKIVWVLSGGGLWHLQHEPSVLENGNILIFDNTGNRGDSRIVEFDPMTREPTWIFAGSEERPFSTRTCGTCQRLPNGNTMITESEAGRALEVTPDRLIVWEFISPHRSGEKNELVATLFDVQRIESSVVARWLTQE